jgi:hypothetical protein
LDNPSTTYYRDGSFDALEYRVFTQSDGSFDTFLCRRTVHVVYEIRDSLI